MLDEDSATTALSRPRTAASLLTVFANGQTPLPFAHVATARKRELGLSYRQLAQRTREVDGGRGMSAAYLVQLFNGNEDPIARNIEVTAAALGLAPDDFVEFRLHRLRQALDERVSFDRAVRNLDALGAEALARVNTHPLDRAGRERHGRRY